MSNLESRIVTNAKATPYRASSLLTSGTNNLHLRKNSEIESINANNGVRLMKIR